MKYYISDLHLFHKNVTKEGKDFDDRPFLNVTEMNNYILGKWNEKINKSDIVYILGDVSLCKNSTSIDQMVSIVAQLKGHKILIKGNHDNVDDRRFLCQFEEITGYKEIRDTVFGKKHKIILSHYPILMWNGQHSGSIHLYGHVHNSIEDDYYRQCLEGMNNQKFFERRDGCTGIAEAYNVGCMMPYMNYEPRTLEEIVRGGREEIKRQRKLNNEV